MCLLQQTPGKGKRQIRIIRHAFSAPFIVCVCVCSWKLSAHSLFVYDWIESCIYKDAQRFSQNRIRVFLFFQVSPFGLLWFWTVGIHDVVFL